MTNNRILKGYIEEGESLVDAIARVAVLAGQNGFKAYAICCRECDEPYGDPIDCRCMREERIAFDKACRNRERNVEPK